MPSTRKDDTENHEERRFRSSRFFHSLDQWYFLTREGTVEGPYSDRNQAETNLATYLTEMAGELHPST